jgi:hypothetical protein
MWEEVKSLATAGRNALREFFLGPLFFILAGCTFIYASFTLLSRLEPCGADQPSTTCLELTQVNLGFGLLSALIGVAIVTYGIALHAIGAGQVNSLKQVYDQIKLFFSSPTFFILLGCFFLYCGFILLDQTHAAFVFILTILGISMIFFGTGSQAVASAELPQRVSGKFSAGIAGGAAALAAIFGYGTILLEERIQGFFQRTVDYGFLELTTDDSNSPNINLDDHTITANMPDGRPLPILKQTSKLQILVPRYTRHDTSIVSVTISGPSVRNVPTSLRTKPYQIQWDSVKPEASAANEKLYIKQLIFVLPSPPTNNPDESGRPVQNQAGQLVEPYVYTPH